MIHSKPTPTNIIRDDFTTGKISGGRGSDHLIHHRDLSVEGHSSTGLVGYAGDDILEASVPNTGQVHMFAATGNDWLILDVTKIPNAGGTQGHHAYGGHGQNTFEFTNIDHNHSPIIGRIDDFDPSSDQILIDGTRIDLTDLPQMVTLPSGNTIEVRVIEIDHPEFLAENLGKQYFLAIGDNIFYALEGARDLVNGTSGLTGEERHFLHPSALETLRNAETVQYENPKNFVPREFYAHREDELNLNWAPKGDDVHADPGSEDAVHMFGGKGNTHDDHASGAQIMRGSDGDDVINGNTGNDTIYGGYGNDLIAGGIDNDVIYGGPGNDMIWGGDGDDKLYGGRGDDYLHGGRGNDFLAGGEGNDILVGGRGNNTLVGGGGEESVNRFHFSDGDSQDVITDFKLYSDLITLQHEIDPLSVELYENKDGNTVLNYGAKGSVELRGVSLKDFQDAAEFRAEEDNPIIAITPDPEDELLQQIRIESGLYEKEALPSLEIEGILYGNTPFWGMGAGGYTYVSEHSVDCHDLCEEPVAPYMLEADQTAEGLVNSDDMNTDPAASTIQNSDHMAEDALDADEEDKDSGGGACFVATAAYRDPWHPDVRFLRAFRDTWLVHRAWGRVFIAIYWRVGPILARPVQRDDRLARISVTMLSGLVRVLRKLFDANSTKLITCETRAQR